MSRKGIEDFTGEQICEHLKENKVIERIELEGNKLGCKSAKALAGLLKV